MAEPPPESCRGISSSRAATNVVMLRGIKNWKPNHNSALSVLDEEIAFNQWVVEAGVTPRRPAIRAAFTCGLGAARPRERGLAHRTTSTRRLPWASARAFLRDRPRRRVCEASDHAPVSVTYDLDVSRSCGLGGCSVAAFVFSKWPMASHSMG